MTKSTLEHHWFPHSFIHSFMDICPKRGLTVALGRGGRTTHTVDAPHREPGAEEGS